MGKTVYYLDIEAAIEKYNQNRPEDEEELTRAILADKLELNYQSLVNYNNGRVPAIVGQILEISKLTGIELNQFLKSYKS